jgi:O-antigen/teichoic acid export membrane protein
MWKNLRNLLFGGVTSKVILGVSNIFLIKVLTKNDFALLSNFLYIQSMVSGLLFTPFLLAAVPIANLKKIQNHNRFYSALNWFQMALLSSLLIIAVFSGPNLSYALFRKIQFYPSILIGLMAAIVMTFQNIMLSQQQTKESYRDYNLISLIRPIALLLILSTLHFTGNLNFWTAAFSFFASILTALFVDISSFLNLFKVSGFRLRLAQFSWFWKSAWMLILFFFIRGTYDHISFYFVSRYFDMENIANFSVPFRYYSMADLIVVTSHIPFINSFTKEPFLHSKTRFKKWLKVTVFISIICILILPFSKELFVLISGEKYESSFPSFVILMLGLIPFLCFSPAIYGVISLSGGKKIFYLSLFVLALHILLCILGAKHQNLELISFSTVFSRGMIYTLSFLSIYFRK